MNEQNIFDVDIHQKLLNINNTAKILGVSTATVRNWVKAGTLPLHNHSHYVFDKKTVEKFKLKLHTGQLDKLTKRANKIKSQKNFIPIEYTNNKKDQLILASIILFVQKNNIDISTALFLLSLNFLKKQKILTEIECKNIIQGESIHCSNKPIKKEINTWLSEINTNSLLNPKGFEKGQGVADEVLSTSKVADKKRENSNKISIKSFAFLLDCALPDTTDCLGVLYQSLLFEGKKSENGSYYTPTNVVHSIVQEYVKADSKVLDPCCGTGQFLLAFSNVTQDPLNIYGIDRDPIAVKIARLNILTRFKDKNFTPKIFHKDALSGIENYSLFYSIPDKSATNFNVIATNPPWGAHFSKEEKKTLKSMYPEISSFESFAYFIEKSLNQLGDQGVASFILPEAILNVRLHRDIREAILRKSEVIKIIRLGQVFKNVFTPVIRLDLKKNQVNLKSVLEHSSLMKYEKSNQPASSTMSFEKGQGVADEVLSTSRVDVKQETSNQTSIYKKPNQVLIQNKTKRYKINQIRWACNLDFIFDIDMDPFDQALVYKIYNTNHTTLKNKADWALGIVTGNNKQFISNSKKSGYEPIYKGKEIQKFILSKPSCFIHFQPDKFQQIAEIEKYRSLEKLIYRFISKELIFAYDDQKRLTLNSANIVIPRVEDYPIKVILSLFNSSVYQFIFQKKFSSIKVLRNHIEALPLPLWNKKTFSMIIKLANNLLEEQACFKKLDNYIMNCFALSEKEKEYIRSHKE